MKSTVVVVCPIASGKGAISELLVSKGYTHFTFRDDIHAELFRKGLPVDLEHF